MSISARALSIVATLGLGGCATSVQPTERGAQTKAEDLEDALADSPEGTVEEQVALGADLFDRRCDACHGTRAEGDGMFGDGPPLVGPHALDGEHGESFANAADLQAFIHSEMPKDHPGTLTPEDAYQLTSYLLYANKITLTAPLGPTNADRVELPAPPVARR